MSAEHSQEIKDYIKMMRKRNYCVMGELDEAKRREKSVWGWKEAAEEKIAVVDPKWRPLRALCSVNLPPIMSVEQVKT